MSGQLEEYLAAMPDWARDAKLNLKAVLGESSLNPQQRLMVAIAAATAVGNKALASALIAEASVAGLAKGVWEDAFAAASLMAMNNIYYRFRHVVGKPEYSQAPARLRMNRLNSVATNKADFELTCLAVSAVNGCEACVRAHEESCLKHGLTTDQVHDAVRTAAVVTSAASLP